ncbi:MAG: ribosome-associated heat shock protein Hsp15 [Alphaproteobacteria bacterium]|nr:ribosome-associated heat shock protein Hsp15 [Alphaproteobacteria bacterium]
MDRQRIDKWLWHARVVRTRSAAAELVTSGLVRLNRERVTAPSRPVRADDVITVALDRQVRIMKVVSFAERRGGSEAGRVLYADLTPLPPPRDESPKVAAREAGSGRPTKRDRRAIDRLLPDEDE